MLSYRPNDQLYVIGVQEKPDTSGRAHVVFFTNRGEMHAHVRVRAGMRQAVILLGGDGEEKGFEQTFDQFDAQLAERNIGSVRVDYRHPGDFAQCAIDALLACQYLDDEGVRDVAMVGWSFGASVAAAAGSVARNVRGVAAISAKEATEQCIRRLRTKPLLLLHGEKDKVYPVEFVNRLGQRPEGPTHLIVYPKAGHDLSSAGPEVRSDLLNWLASTFNLTLPNASISRKM